MIPNAPPANIPHNRRLVLASGSPRRAQLLAAAGYSFEVFPPDDSAECGMCSRERAPELVARLAFQKAKDVAVRIDPSLVLAADTVADWKGQILGKPRDREHAESMLRRLRGQPHAVYTGICLWLVPENQLVVDVSVTSLEMHAISDQQLEDYLDTEKWCGKAGAFGYQDGNDWLKVVSGSESNVVGLPLERFAEILNSFHELARPL